MPSKIDPDTLSNLCERLIVAQEKKIGLELEVSWAKRGASQAMLAAHQCVKEPEGAREKGGDNKNLDEDVTRAKDLQKVTDEAFDEYKAKRDEADKSDMEADMIRKEAAVTVYADALAEAMNKKIAMGAVPGITQGQK